MTCEQRCLEDERPGRADDVNMVHISQKSPPVPSDEAMVLKIPTSDSDRIQALDYISITDYKNAIYTKSLWIFRENRATD